MHPIHGMSMHPPQLSPAPPPPPKDADGKTKSIFTHLDAVIDQAAEEGKLDPDAQGNSGQNPSQKKPRKKEPVPKEKPAAALPPAPPPQVKLGVYNRTGKPETPPPPAGGTFKASM